MKDALHRILSGSPEHRIELVAAGVFVAIWFGMDVVEFADWVYGKVQQAPQQSCALQPQVSPRNGPTYYTVRCAK